MTDLLHAYDAAKRREYYLKNRQLKGRTRSTASLASPKRTNAKKLPAKKTHAQRQKELEARVVRLQAKFKQLQAALKVVIEAAQKRSGIEKNTAEKVQSKYEPKKSADPSSKYEKKTQKQKDAAAEASQKYRDKNEVLTDQVEDLNNKIKSIRDRIKRIQKTGSVGASKPNTR